MGRVQGAVARDPPQHEDRQDHRLDPRGSSRDRRRCRLRLDLGRRHGVDAVEDQTIDRTSDQTHALAAAAPYNVWIGGGSIWVAEDQGARVIRVSPATSRILKRLPVGDGPADMAFAGNSAWVINHRDRRLMRINLSTNSVTKLVTVPGDAPERMTWLAGSLWITGRGTDLIQVDPQTGAVKATIEIGAGGIDVVSAAGALWVPARNEVVDPTGFPTMEALRRVSVSTRQVTTAATAGGRLDVHGLQAGGGFVWIADNRSGFVYRVRT